MTKPDTKRQGWCPTLFEPMPAGDGLLVRLKPSCSNLSIEAAIAVAEAASLYGNGIVELTSRANLQFRGFSSSTVADFSELAVSLGLGSADPRREKIRNVLTSPLGGDDPDALFNSHVLASSVETSIASYPDLFALPPKFGFLVDGGGALALSGVRADIMIRAVGDLISIEVDGSSEFATCSATDAAEAATSLARAFVRVNASHDHPFGRMRDLVGSLGTRAIFDIAGLKPCSPRNARGGSNVSVSGLLSFNSPRYLAVSLPYGEISADQMIGLATAARTAGAGRLGLTPWRSLVFPGISLPDADHVKAWAESAGLITRPCDPRLQIAACPGSPRCANATVRSREDADFIASLDLPERNSVHISACGKGCARQTAADFTLVGNLDGLYSLVRYGRATDVPESHGLNIEQAAQRMRGS